MKQIYKIFLGVIASFPLLTGCEDDLPVYTNPNCGLKFEYEYDRDSVYSYSFAFEDETVVQDTVWFDVRLVGDLKDYDRPIALSQVMTGKNDAVAGEHYVPFDDPGLASKLIMPANAIDTKLPVVVKKGGVLKGDDMADVTLKVTFKVNEAFVYAVKERDQRGILIANYLIQPNNWDTYCNHFFGAYSRVKHQAMIDATGFKWDNEFVDVTVAYYFEDQNVITSWVQKVNVWLAEYEAEHGEPLRDENGNIVTMGM